MYPTSKISVAWFIIRCVNDRILTQMMEWGSTTLHCTFALMLVLYVLHTVYKGWYSLVMLICMHSTNGYKHSKGANDHLVDVFMLVKSQLSCGCFGETKSCQNRVLNC